MRKATERINEKLAAIDAQLLDAVNVDVFEGVIGAADVAAAFDGLDLGRQRTIVDALLEITVNPVGKGARVFDPDSIHNGRRAIDVRWRQ